MSAALDKDLPRHSSGQGPWLLAVLTVVLVSAVAYANGLGGEFALDDRAFLVDNPKLTASHDLAYFFSGDMYSYSVVDAASATYRPFFFAVFWLFNAVWPGSALALHLFSLALHIVATLLVLAAIPRLVPGITPLAAGIGACLFAVHPVHVEAVTWISAFVHPMATVFILAALLAHDRHRRTKQALFLGAAGFFFILAVLTAETGVGFPFFVLVWDWIRSRRPEPLRAAPYFVLLAAYALVRISVLGAATPLGVTNLESWLRLPLYAIEYLGYLVLPYPQTIYLVMPPAWTVSAMAVLGAAVLAALFGFAVVQRTRNRQAVLTAAAWIATSLLPPLLAVLHPAPLFTLRSLYLPSLGIAILAAWYADGFEVIRRQARSAVAVSAALLLLPLGLTVAESGNWRDDGRVSRRIIEFNPGSFRGYRNLGLYLSRTGDAATAVQAYEKAIRLAGPEHRADTLEALGLLLGQSGEAQRSLKIYQQVVALDPDRSSAWVGVGNNLWYLGRLPEAADAYRKAYAADTGNREACYNLVLVLKKLGKAKEASRYANCAANLP